MTEERFVDGRRVMPLKQARQAMIDHAGATTLEHMRALQDGAACCAIYADLLIEAVRLDEHEKSMQPATSDA